MKLIKRLFIIALACVLSLSVVLFASPKAAAASDELLYVEKAVQISDTQLLVFFSEPIAFNLNGNSKGPWTAIRVVGKRDAIIKTSEGKYLQWQCTTQFANEEHDVLLLTYGYDKENITTILNWEGMHAGYAAGNKIKLLKEVGVLGIIRVDEGREILDLPAIGGEEGNKRLQTPKRFRNQKKNFR